MLKLELLLQSNKNALDLFQNPIFAINKSKNIKIKVFFWHESTHTNKLKLLVFKVNLKSIGWGKLYYLQWT